jgi:hypothetical protein
MKVKPIFVIRFSKNQIGNHSGETREIITGLQKQLKGYHVLGLIDDSLNGIQFECFNGPEDEKEFELLKEKAHLILGECEKLIISERDKSSTSNQEWILRELGEKKYLSED